MKQANYSFSHSLQILAMLVVFGWFASPPNANAHEEASFGEGQSRTFVQKMEDTGTTFKISNFIKKNEELEKSSNINVTTVNDIVLLTGTVKTAEQKEWVQNLSESHPNVREVINELRVSKKRGLRQMTRDKYTQAAIKLQLSSYLRSESTGVYVVVAFDTVYLMGHVDSEVAKFATAIARSQNSVERVITIFEVDKTVDLEIHSEEASES